MLKVFPCQNNWLSFFVCFANISGSYCFVWVDSFESNLFSEILYLEFSGLHYCLFVKVHCVVLFSSNSVIISRCPNFVNNFLKLFPKTFSNIFQRFYPVSVVLVFACRGNACFSRWIFNISHTPSYCHHVFLNIFIFLHFYIYSFFFYSFLLHKILSYEIRRRATPGMTK